MKSHRTTDMIGAGTLSFAAVAVAILVTSLGSGSASAKLRQPTKKDKEACQADYAKGKERAEAAVLTEARDSFSRCAKVECGSFLQQECGLLYTRLNADIPSIVPFVTDEAGTPRSLVELRMDGTLLTSRLDGKALQVNPGKHEFSFSTDDGVFASRKVMVLQGQRNIPVKAVLSGGRRRGVVSSAANEGGLRQATYDAPAEKNREAETAPGGKVTETEQIESAAPVVTIGAAGLPAQESDLGLERTYAAPRRGIPKLSYVFGGLGVVGVAGYFVLNSWGRKDNAALDTCASMGQLCMASDIDHVRRIYRAANISGAVGLAALATSAYLYLRSASAVREEPSNRVASRQQSGASLRMADLTVGQSGAMATVGGAF